MDSKEIFTSALGLQSPWSVSRAEFQTNESGTKELHLWITFERGFLFTAPDGSHSTAYDTLDKTWRHLNFFQHHCYIHCNVPRVRYGKKQIAMVSVPWARPNSGFTLLFEAYSMLFIEEEMPVSSVSKVTQATVPRIWRVFKYWVNEAYERSDWSEVRRIGVDETSRRKGHCYITQFVDLDTHRTLFAVEGKDSETFGAFKTELQRKGGDPAQIKLISMDMSSAFICGRNEYFPNAEIVFDKFHLVQCLNQALDEVRKAEHKNSDLLKCERFTFLRNPSRLSREKLHKLDKMLISYPNIGEAYGLREGFMDTYLVSDAEEAKGYLAFWCDVAIDAKLEPFRKFVNTIKAHWSGIVSYFENRGVTNGVLEGINSKIQLAKRRARGYRDVDNFIRMIYYMSGKLDMAYPHDSL